MKKLAIKLAIIFFWVFMMFTLVRERIFRRAPNHRLLRLGETLMDVAHPVADLLVLANEVQRHHALRAIAMRNDLQLGIALKSWQALAHGVSPIREKQRDLIRCGLDGAGIS